MPMSRTRRGRLKQVESWLRTEFPTPYRCYVRVERFTKDNKADGETYRVKSGALIVRINSALKWSPAIHTLLHEWAHAYVWRQGEHSGRLADNCSSHDEEWGIAYAKIYRAFVDDGGTIASRSYPDL